MRPVLPFSHGPASVAALVLVLCTVLPAQSIEAEERATVFLVRHAEKASHGPDPELTDAGALRARALASLLRDAGLQAIHSTDYRRTRDTAAPLAAQLGLEVTIYDPEKLAALATDIRQRGGRCLVVGHSNTTPELVGLLGGEPGAAIDEKSEYDRLYVVTIGPEGTVGTVLLRYGR
jgi:broad specificity phosphatase PhoE